MNVKLRTCQEEYANDAKIKEDEIREMKKWVDEQPHLPSIKGTSPRRCLKRIDSES